MLLDQVVTCAVLILVMVITLSMCRQNTGSFSSSVGMENFDKSSLTPSQAIGNLGLIINSILMTDKLTPGNVINC